MNWATIANNNNYGREAFAKPQLGPRSGRHLELGTIGNNNHSHEAATHNNYVHEAAAFLKATNNNKEQQLINYSCEEAAVFLKATKNINYGREAATFLKVK